MAKKEGGIGLGGLFWLWIIYYMLFGGSGDDKSKESADVPAAKVVVEEQVAPNVVTKQVIETAVNDGIMNVPELDETISDIPEIADIDSLEIESNKLYKSVFDQ